MKKRRILCFLLLISLLLSGCGIGKRNRFESLEDFKNARQVDFATCANNVCYNPMVQKDIPNVSFSAYTNYFDTFVEVAKGKRDAALCFSSIFIGLQEAYPSLECIVSEQTVPIVAFFSNRNEALKREFDDFVRGNPAILRQLKMDWVDSYGHNDLTVSFDDLESRNGTFTFAVCPDSVPMEYLKNGKPAGFEVALIHSFAEHCGYGVKTIVTDYVASMTGVATGKYDVSVGFFGYTEERSEGILLSEPYYNEPLGYVVLGDAQGSTTGFGEQLRMRFERNFLRENRWQLIVNGLKTTVEITAFAVVLGSVLGFALFLLGRKQRLLRKLAFMMNEFFESLPTLVVLLVFFYVIFGDSAVSGFLVAAMVFMMLFTFTYFAQLTGSVDGIPQGQTEAALALGYTPLQALTRVMLPQAMVSFLPAYKSSVIGILKATSIVGYVAVQDLTSAGDRIRSLTFDALFPILGITLIYFAIARLLIWLMNRLLTVDPEKNRERFRMEVERSFLEKE